MATEPLNPTDASAALSAASAPRGEIASIARDINRVMFGGVLENLDETLKTRGLAKGLKIYDELARDAHTFAVLQKRKLAVTSRAWQVDPASSMRRDKQAAELVSAQFKALGLDRLTRNLLDATLKGFSVAEVLWQVDEQLLTAAHAKHRNARRFAFGEDEKLRLLTRESPMTGEALPERKFIVHRFGDDESPYGLGLGHKLFWPVFFKRQGITFWLTFADKFGMPTAVGKYPSGAGKPEQKKLLDALAAIAQDAGVIVPEGMLIELLEPSRAGSIDTYEKLVRYMDEQISECVLGETLSTTPKSTGLGSGVATVQNEVRKEIAKADADEISETLNETLVRWIVDFNFGTAPNGKGPTGAGYPMLTRRFEEPADLGEQAKRDKSIFDMGFKPSLAYVQETYGGEWVERAASAPPTPGAPGSAGAQTAPTAFAEPAPADSTDPLATEADQMSTAAAPAWDALLGAIRAEVDRAPDLPTLQRRLTDLYGGLDTAELVNIMAAGFALAELKGMADAQERA